MRVRVMSDLHMELPYTGAVEALRELTPVEEDVWVLPGDITSFRFLTDAVRHYQAIDAVNPAVPKIVVAGNHEFWKLKPKKGEATLEGLRALLPNFRFLDNSMVEIGGRRFLGGTMWYDDVDGLNQIYEHSFPDFHLIKGFVPWGYEKHKAFRRFMDENLRPGDIVVTHHAPLMKSVSSKYLNNDLNRFYVSDCAKIIDERRPAAWFHGHTHTFRYYQVGDTWVVCNPRGYPSDGDTGFAPNLIVEL